MKRSAEALVTLKKALELAELIGGRQAICESRLLLAEVSLEQGETEESVANLQSLAQLITDSPADLLLVGEAQRLHGLLTMAGGDASTAAQHFGRSVSIFDLLGDRYRSARAHFELGRAYAIAQPERAAEHLTRAGNIFRAPGAHLNLSRAEEAAVALDQNTPQQLRKRGTVVQLLTLRLAEAVASRELLLRELAAVIRQETNAARVVIIEPDESGRQRVGIAHGCSKKESEAWAEDYANLKKDSGGEAFAKKHNVTVVSLKSTNGRPATF